jgi:hypothetical protein
MFDYEARHIVEALRSGIPSRAVGQYFSEARPQIMRDIMQDITNVCDEDISGGKVISGKYGEGKTHLLNTVFNIANTNNMVVSYIPLSKETPFDKLYVIYQKVMNNTYLPNRLQPGFTSEFDKLTPNSPLTSELLLFAAKQLETDRLYYALRSFINTDDQDERFLLQTDLEGDFVSNQQIKQIYKRIFGEKVVFNKNFVKSKHYMDYFSFLSRLFSLLGYKGWVLLFDEAELIGRLGKKTRMKAYNNMSHFLFPQKKMHSTYSMFAISASYNEDVIEGKHEMETLRELDSEEDGKPINQVLESISQAPQLAPLTNNEIHEVLLKLIHFHSKAYDWKPEVDVKIIQKTTDTGGYLLRTKIRSAIEYLDQLYQYGEVGKSTVNSLQVISFEEEMPSLDDVWED